jgi:WD40 repeat protein
MGDLINAVRDRRGSVFSWRRWQVGLAGLGALAWIATGGGDLGTGGGDPGQAARISQEDHEAPIWALTFAGNTRMATATTTGDIRLKDLATGRVLRLQDRPGLYGPALASPRDGRILAIAGRGTSLRFWDTETGIEQEPLTHGVGPVRTVAFSPDATALAVGTWKLDGQAPNVTVWEWPGRRRLVDLGGHRGSINGLAFSPDRSRLVSADSTGLVKLWDVGAGEERASVQAHEAGLVSAAFSPDGHRFATASYVDGDVRLWDAADGRPRGSLPRPSTAVAGLAFAPDGTTLATARGDGIASLWDVATGRELGSVRAPSGALQSVAFSDDGRMLATGGVDGSVRLWDLDKVLNGNR